MHERAGIVIVDGLEEIVRLLQFVRLCGYAFHKGSGMPEILKQIGEARRNIAVALNRPSPPETEFDAHLKDFQPVVDFARDELSKGTPYLFSLVTIRLWSILEAVVDDVVGFRLLEPTGFKNKRVFSAAMRWPVFCAGWARAVVQPGKRWAHGGAKRNRGDSAWDAVGEHVDC